ncbi:ScbA/BarX family gamma-butyrolactone biosynthesis protein [Streptomyces sp. C11-1]|uniref:ScbA/BarX family gamma-butyrolactone biosynthesis protein n=1 Tax=Streptomyces durocortorensis TaxID=2811104 RepID=A0ABY9VZJ1_9ACTN|nr:ScbA/BarX family gamma-butyrolactone biosynthesis protein [Streptomyces durocortorensis]WNF29322.1 ScbA/BarX family gamma-butyrolactone biosynthesis protein [Streptomyces durocortorensis]
MPSTATVTLAPPVAFVAGELVHKARPGSVLLTGLRPDGSDGFVVSAHWPEVHEYYAARGAALDLLLLTETVRQSFPLLCHSAYDVPLGHHLLWDDFGYELTPAALAPGDRSGPVELHVTCLESTRRGSRAAALTLLISVVRGGRPLAECTTRLTVQSPAVYRRLRAGRGTPEAVTALPAAPIAPIAPSVLGRTRLRDVVLSPAVGLGRWRLRVDTTHPLFFDHPLDHAPGLLLLEAARQAALMLPSDHPQSVTGMETSFHRYVELDAPCRIEARPLDPAPEGHRRTVVSLWQDGVECFTATVRLARKAGPGPAALVRAGGDVIPFPR